MPVSVEDVSERFELDEYSRATLARLAAAFPAQTVAVPTREDARRLLTQVHADSRDINELLDAYPDEVDEPELRWIVERCAAELSAHIGNDTRISNFWPNLPRRFGPAARCVHVWAFLAVVEQLREHHRTVGVPDDVSVATASDLAPQLRRYRRWTGAVGLDEQFWLTLPYSGRLLQIGRLQYDRFRFDAPPTNAPFSAGEPALDIHIPGESLLHPADVGASLIRASALFTECFPDWNAKWFVCDSWLLDPRLRTVLASNSNIVAFQDRFTIANAPQYVADVAVIYFVFGQRRTPPLEVMAEVLEPTTRLQHAIIDHLVAGGHWHSHLGWIPRASATGATNRRD